MVNNSISIIIPTFNRAHLIGETLDSIIAQNYKNWECIIVDDGSSDNSQTIIEDYLKKDIRFKFYKRPVERIKGANSCRNFGFEKSSGNFIKWFDSDDIMHPDFLIQQIEMLSNDPELDFCSSFSYTFSGSINNITGAHNPTIISDDENCLLNYIQGKLFFLTPSPLWKKSFLKDKILFDEKLHDSHETDFNFRRLTETPKFRYITNHLFYVRRGHDSIDLSLNRLLSLESAFCYLQKVYDFLNLKTLKMDCSKRSEAIHHILMKQAFCFYNYRMKSGFVASFKFYFKVCKNVLFSPTNLNWKIKLLFGLFVVLAFKKGFHLVHKK